MLHSPKALQVYFIGKCETIWNMLNQWVEIVQEEPLLSQQTALQ